jgi:hypothetical protein
MRHALLVPLLCCLLAAGAATAAPVRTLAFDLPEPELAFDIRQADGKPESPPLLRIEARRNQFSDPLDLAPGRYLARSDSFAAPVSFTLPDEEGGRYLLLILPTNDGTCHIFPIPDDVARIGPGDRFLLNATAGEIAVRFGKIQSRVKPGHSTYLRPPKPAPADKRIEVEMTRRVAGKWVPFNSTYWPLDPKARSFVLVYPDPGNGQPRVRNLSEVP